MKKSSITFSLLLSLFFLLSGCQQKQPQWTSDISSPSYTAGNVEGDFKVNNNGAAIYEIPIEIPVGTAGMQPDLSLSYNNQGSNGLLGVGWSLSGLSAISRCPKTFAQDGVKAGVDFTRNDRFCVDGMRLVAVRGTYGANGTEYRTEQEQWTRYYSRGTCGNGPCYFSAEAKDGSLTTYGKTTDSRILATGKKDVRIWSVDKRQDRNSNDITVAYHNDASTGEYYPITIAYTGNSNTKMAPARRVQFTYDTNRPDPSISYVAGTQVQSNARMTGVSTYVGNDLVKTYNIGYTTSALTGQSLIAHISECGNDGSCFAPTTFTWDNTFQSNHAFAYQQWGQGGVYQKGSAQSMGDFNADSATDVGYIYNNSGDIAIDVYLSDGTTFTQQSWYAGSRRWESGEFVGGDFNGDGISDIAHVFNNSGHIGIDAFLSNRTTFTQQSWYTSKEAYDANAQVSSGDVNGDGIADIIYAFSDAGKIGIHVYLGTGSAFIKSEGLSTSSGVWSNRASLHTGDFNHDGLTDLAYAYNDAGNVGIRLYTSTGTVLQESSIGMNDLPWIDDSLFSFSDYNGDGKTDISYFFNNSGTVSAQVLISTGESFTSSRWMDSSVVWGGAKIIKSADYNGDSLTDVAYVYQGADKKANIDTFLSTGAAFTPFNSVESSGDWGDEAFTPSDFKADGLADIVNTYNDSGKIGFAMYLSQDGSGPSFALKQSDLLNVIVTGMKETITIEYKPLSDSDIYEKRQQSAQFPAVNVQIPYYVVAKHEIYEPISRTTSQSAYTFQGAQVNLQGRGWEGFSTFTVRNTSDANASMQTDTVKSFYQDFPLTGLQKQQTIKRVSDGAILWETNTTYGDVSSKLVPAVSIVYKEEKNVLGYSNGTWNYTLGEQYVYDSDYKVIVRTDYTNSDGPDHASCSQYLTPERDNDWWHAFYKRANKVVATSSGCSHPDFSTWDGTTDLRFYQYGYDKDTLNLTSTSQWNDQQHAFSTSTMDYDAYGNVVSHTDPAGNTSTVTYDDVYHTFPAVHTSPAPESGSDPLVLKTVYNPEFNVLIQQVDANGNTVMEIPADGLDAFGRVIKQNSIQPTNTALVTTSIRAYEAGVTAGVNVSQRLRDAWTDANQSSWFWETKAYDALGRMYRQDSQGPHAHEIVSQTEFNNQGLTRRASLPYYSDETAHFTDYQYDIKQRLIGTTYPTGAKNGVVYQPDDNRIIQTLSPDPSATATGNGRVTSTITVDNYGQKIKSVAPNSGVTEYRYDVLGQMLDQIDPLGMKTEYTYTSLGLLATLSDPEQGKTVYTYNSSGKLVTVVNGIGERTHYDYDALWRVTQTEYFDANGTRAKTVVNTYDTAPNGKGLLATLTAPDVAYNFAYDYNGRMASRTTAMTVDGASKTYTTTYAYDPLGRQTRIGLPDGSSVAYTLFATGATDTVTYRDTEGQATTLVTYNRYDAMSDLEKATFHNGVVDEAAYDVFGRITSNDLRQGQDTLRDFAYEWNLANKILSITDQRTHPTPSLTQTLSYNDMGFLTHSSGVYGTIDYQYNLTGDITAQNDIRYTYDTVKKHQMISGCTLSGEACHEMLTLSYNGLGNIVEKTTISSGTPTQWQYDYDVADNLQNIHKGIGGQAPATVGSFTYGADWLRIKKVSRDGSVTYYISPEYVISVDASKNHHVDKYVSSEHGTVALIDGASITYFHLNNIGSSTVLTTDTGAPKDQVNYTPFGAIDANSSDITTEFIPKFTGKEFDTEGELYYFGARYYDADLNRFISPDPARQFASPYVYGNNDPLVYTDPDGQFFGIDDAIEIAVAAEIAADVAVETAATATTVAVAAGEATGAIGLAVETEAEVSAIATVASMEATGVGVEATQAEVTSAIVTESIVSGSESVEVSTGIDVTTEGEIAQSETSMQSFAESNMEDDAASSFEQAENSGRYEARGGGPGGSDGNTINCYDTGSCKTYVNTGKSDYFDMQKAFVDTKSSDNTLVLSGTHGDEFGWTAAEDSSLAENMFYQEDQSAGWWRTGTVFPKGQTNIVDVGSGQISSSEIDQAMAKGVFRGKQYNCVIGAFCYSEVRFQMLAKPNYQSYPVHWSTKAVRYGMNFLKYLPK